MSAFGFELRQAARRVFTWKQTGAIMIPAIGLALATIMFAVGWGYSSLSLPYKDADRLVAVGYVIIETPGDLRSDPTIRVIGDIQPFFDWKERKDVFIDVAATQLRVEPNNSLITKTPNGNVKILLSNATVNYFDVLGISFPGIQAWKASIGSQKPVSVVLPYKIGTNGFDYPEIGQKFQTHDGDGLVVNGVLPLNFVSLSNNISESGFVPFEPKLLYADRAQMEAMLEAGLGWSNLSVIGRLAPGVTPQIAEQMLSAASGGEREVVFGYFGQLKERLTVRPISDIIAESSKPIVWGAWALGALTLLLCTANLAGLLLTRCVYRLREYAMRSALGARFSDLLRMMLAELILLSALAALIAAAIAHGAMPAIAERVPITLAAFGQPAFNYETVIFLIIATLFVVVAGGFLSAVALARNYYKGFSQGIFAVFHSHRMLRIILTVSQVAIATVLLCLSWMTMSGYLDLFSNDPGVDTDVRIVDASNYPGMSIPARYAFALDTLESLRAGDSNARIAVIAGGLLNNGIGLGAFIWFPDGTPLFSCDWRISPGLFRTLKVEILAGRDFTERDNDNVLLINESFAQRMGWPTPVQNKIKPHNRC